MKVKMARAEDGFISQLQNNQAVSGNSFIEILQKILSFSDIDIQDFNGNSFTMASGRNPTNSIFIVLISEINYIYMVTNAVPEMHKNQMLWYCDCYNMGSESIVLPDTTIPTATKMVMINNVCYNNKPILSSNGNNTVVKAVVKDNFRPLTTLKKEILSATKSNLCCIKIKFYVNPTNLQLQTKSYDGSYNFIYPILNYGTLGEENRYINDGGVWANVPNITSPLKIADIISKYSPQIKSIEFLPFLPIQSNDTNPYIFGGGGITSYNIDTSSRILYIDLASNSFFTECGVFVPQGHTNYFNGIELNPNYFPLQLVKGGGARGFLESPQSNIPVEFSETNTTLIDSGSCIKVKINDEGFNIDGIFKCEAPPCFLNFYTDNAGQLFIQNQTTNALELRQIERETASKYYEQQQNYVYKQVTDVFGKGLGAIGNAISMNFKGVVGNIGSGLSNALQYSIENEFNKEKIGREYSRAVTEYRDKMKTQSLLASLTGVEITGNYSLLDFIRYYAVRYYCLYFEFNYIIQFTSDKQYVSYHTQEDYNYSIDTCFNPVAQELGESSEIILNKPSDLANALSIAFGLVDGGNVSYTSDIGLTHYVSFKFIPTRINSSERLLGYYRESPIFTFPVRKYNTSIRI